MGIFDFLKKRDVGESSAAELAPQDEESKKEKISRLLDSFAYDDLGLANLQAEAETVFSYLNYLSSAVSSYVGDHNYSRVDARLRVMQEHVRKMSKLIDRLILLYYNPIIDLLSDVNEIEFKREIDNMIMNLSREKKELNDLVSLVSKFDSISEGSLASGVNTGDVGRIIEESASKLSKLLIGRESIRVRIRREDPIEVVRGLVAGQKP